MDDPESIIERFDTSAHDAINQPNRVLVNIYAELESTNEAVADALHEAKLARKAAEEARKASMMTIALLAPSSQYWACYCKYGRLHPSPMQ